MLPTFFTDDHLDLLKLFASEEVDYLPVGGVVVNYDGYNRSTGDVDIFYRSELGNVERLYGALETFPGGSVPTLDGSDDLLEPGLVLQFGVPPNRIDLVNDISGVEFEEAWQNRVTETVEGNGDLELPLIHLDNLLENKKASDRPKDRDDYEYLQDLQDNG